MRFIVTNHDGSIKRREFDTFIRLLQKRGIDWSCVPRVPEPGKRNRWQYVWDNRDEANAFCDELRKETRDNRWKLHELPTEAQPSQGTLMPVVILMRQQSLGAEFSLHPHSKTLVRRRFPAARLISSISIEWITKNDFEQQHGPIWDQIAEVLTGLTDVQLEELGGYEIIDATSEQTVFDTRNSSPI